MGLNLICVKDLLARYKLVPDDLHMLTPNNQNYSCLLLQAAGPIYADKQRIGHLNTEIAEMRCLQFLEFAKTRTAHLAVTPEYCLPWATLRNCISQNILPSSGSLWVLGCESITPQLLNSFKDEVDDSCIVLFDDDYQLAAESTYFDPVVYLFCAKDILGRPKYVAIVQFKTKPSRDSHFLENQCLILGQTIYSFQNSDRRLSVSAIICSDAFNFEENHAILQKIVDRSILIHIQLNPDPRHNDYRAYRTSAFRLDHKLADCDLVTLNWARGIICYGENQKSEAPWPMYAGSTWYVPNDRCSTKDDQIHCNHTNGMYYSYLPNERRHALLFHYDEAVFELSVSKAFSTGPGVISNKLGPTLIHRYLWNSDANQWKPSPDQADSGFESQCDDEIRAAIANMIPNAKALEIERVLSISSGKINFTELWHQASELENCKMGQDEVVQRVTFALDPRAVTFRHAKLQAVSEISHLLSSSPQWPPQVKDLCHKAYLKWDENYPHCNVYQDNSKPALVAYLGEGPMQRTIDVCRDGLYHILRKENAPHKNRFCIAYRHHGKLIFPDIAQLTRIDASDGSGVDFTETLSA